MAGTQPRPLRKRARYVDLEKDTQFSEAWVTLAVILTLVGIVLSNAFLTAAALSLLVIAAVTWLWNEFSLYGLHYERRLSETRAFLGETIELTLEVHNQKFLPLSWLSIIDRFPSSLLVNAQQVDVDTATNFGEFHSFWMPGAFQRLTRTYRVSCNERGYFTYGPAMISTGDGFGLFSRRATFPQQQRLIVYPRLYTVAELRLPHKNPFGEQAARGKLFEDPLRTVGIREWQPADSQRRIHWKATAHHRQVLSRAYEPSAEPQVLIFLNVATLERHWHGYVPDLLERAVSVAASLAALAATQKRPVGLIANGALPNSDQPLRLLPGRSPEQLVRILELLAAVTFIATGPLEEMLLHEAPRTPWGSTIVVVSGIAHPALLSALLTLVQAGRQIVLLTLAEEPPVELLPGMTVLHLPHLVEDLIVPQEVSR